MAAFEDDGGQTCEVVSADFEQTLPGPNHISRALSNPESCFVFCLGESMLSGKCTVQADRSPHEAPSCQDGGVIGRRGIGDVSSGSG